MGAGNPTISRETETQVPAAWQPQPWQPHIIKLISQLQNPTRKISDTWIIDTGKRQTRYQLVKVHQTIWQPHKQTLCPGFVSVRFYFHLLSPQGFPGGTWQRICLPMQVHSCIKKSPGVGNGNPPQDSCLENTTDRGLWRGTVRWVAEWYDWAHHTHSKVAEVKAPCLRKRL